MPARGEPYHVHPSCLDVYVTCILIHCHRDGDNDRVTGSDDLSWLDKWIIEQPHRIELFDGTG